MAYPPMSIEQFLTRVDRRDDGCWIWTGALTRGGYGKTKVLGRTTVAHRYCYEQLVGPIPEGLQLDHLCRVRACVNPDHLEPVTCQENLLRGETFQAANAAKTHCPSGHEYTPANTLSDSGGRGCRTCKRARTAAWRASNLEEARRRDREAARRRRATAA